MPIFLDTNVWVYSILDQDLRKQGIALDLVESGSVVLSHQVIGELMNVLIKIGVDNAVIRKMLSTTFGRFEILRRSRETYLKALDLRARYKLSHWDSLLITDAMDANCSTFYSEDLQHGLKIEQLTITNPFRIG